MLIQVEGGTNAGRRRVKPSEGWTCPAGHENYRWATECRTDGCKEGRGLPTPSNVPHVFIEKGIGGGSTEKRVSRHV